MCVCVCVVIAGTSLDDVCASDQFKCPGAVAGSLRGGECIPKLYLCDGQRDCQYGEVAADEAAICGEWVGLLSCSWRDSGLCGWGWWLQFGEIVDYVKYDAMTTAILVVIAVLLLPVQLLLW